MSTSDDTMGAESVPFERRGTESTLCAAGDAAQGYDDPGLTDYMIHASVALIIIAHVLFGGDLLSVWGGTQEQVEPLLEAARTVTALVPIDKVSKLTRSYSICPIPTGALRAFLQEVPVR
jgi:hypothetical protein